MTIIFELLKPYIKHFVIAGLIIVALGFISYRIYDSGYDSGYETGERKYLQLVSDLQDVAIAAELKAAEAKAEVVIEYKDKIIYLEKKSTKVKEKIKNGALHEESTRCAIGPEFVRLHNESAKD